MVRFGDFVMDVRARQLRRGARELHLSPKAFDLLSILIASRPAVVSKEALRDQLWPGTNVVDANLNNLASEIRTVLGDDAQRPRFVRTVHRVGYAFCGEGVEDSEASVPDARPRPRAWLIWNDRAFALDGQRAEIGRDPGCAIWIDAPGVSRRHAAIDWRADRPTLTDLDSTNGTVVEGRRIEDATPLAEGQTIAIGDATLIFRTAAAMDAPTKKIRKR